MPRKTENLSQSLDGVTRAHASQIRSLFPSEKYRKVLEIGCGIGRLSHALYSLKYEVTGLDLSEGYVMFAREHRPGPNYVIGDTSILSGDQFDLIICVYKNFGSTDTNKKPSEILQNWSQLLKPEGSLLIECGSMDWARSNFSEDKDTLEKNSGDLHTTVVFNQKDRRLETSYSFNGISYKHNTFLFESEELVSTLQSLGFDQMEILESLNRNPSPGKDHFFVKANKSTA